MPDALIDAVESFPSGSSAPAIVGLIYSMKNLTIESKRAMSAVFLAGYRAMMKGE